MDESFKRPGSVPFQWEIKPGTPKPYFQSSPFQSRTTTMFAPKRLNPPPIMTPPVSPCASPSPAFFHRSNSTSSTKWRSPQQSPRPSRSRSIGPEIVAQGCIPLATVKKANGHKSKSKSSTNVTCNKRSVSGLHTSSSSSAYSFSCLPPGFTRPFVVREEVESVARWII